MTNVFFQNDLIKIVENEDKFDCYFSIHLKDDFKQAFPSAKWDSWNKCWQVSTRVRKRLMSWIEHAQEAAKAAEELEQLELDTKEIERLKRRAEELRQEIVQTRHRIEEEKTVAEQIQELRQKEQKLIEMLKQDAENLRQAEQQRLAEQEALNKQRAEIDALLSKIIDIRHLKGVVLSTFAKYHNQAGATAHRMFDEAQSEFCEARSKLAEAGYGLQALDYLCKANFNRPDRDSVKFMPKDAWYRLYKIETEETEEE